ncbi:MAG: T9SS type A sorting domain-containing protein, partial [bacterium]
GEAILYFINDSSDSIWIVDTHMVIINPFVDGWWLQSCPNGIFPCVTDSSLLLYFNASRNPWNSTVWDWSRLLEARLKNDGTIVWDTIGISEPYLDLEISLSNTSSSLEVLLGNVLCYFLGPGNFYGSLIYRDAIGYSNMKTFYHGDSISHQSMCFGHGDTIAVMFTGRNPPYNIYYGLGKVDELVLKSLGEDDCAGSPPRQGVYSPDCAFDSEGNFYVSWWTRGDYPDKGPWIKCLVPPDTVSGISERALPENDELRIYPNPFNESCRIISKGGEVSIYDLNGKLVFNSEGEKEFVWEGINNESKILPSGVYLVKDELGNSKKLIMVK